MLDRTRIRRRQGDLPYGEEGTEHTMGLSYALQRRIMGWTVSATHNVPSACQGLAKVYAELSN